MSLVHSLIFLAEHLVRSIPWSTRLALGMLLGVAQGAALSVAWLDPLDGTVVGLALGTLLALGLHAAPPTGP